MLNGLEDKVKRALLMQELSNTCHLEYRRAQAAFRRQMSMRPGVAGARFKRITVGSNSRIAIKGQPSDCTVSDPQLHYILRQCHPDTNHKDAAQWIQKLDDHTDHYPNDRRRLSGNQIEALGDLAIIISFMHTLSLSLAMVPSSKKSGLIFTGRAAEMDAEMIQYRAEADFGDAVVPMDNLLEPEAASNALQALNEFIVEKAGANLGTLYEDMLDECLEDIGKKYADAKQRVEKIEKKTHTPLTAEEPKPTGFRVEQRREKAKTRPAETRIHDITPFATRHPTTQQAPSPKMSVKASVAAVFDSFFARSEARGSVPWTNFAAAMAELGFSVTPKGGSIFTSNPPASMSTRSITLHRPHSSDIESWKLLYFARRLSRAYGWDGQTFVVG